MDHAATQPSSDTFYVARGLTAERADALRQTLIVPQNGPEVQVTVQSAQPLMQPATTEPSVMTDKNVNALGLGLITGRATSQPSDSNIAESGGAAPAATAPSPEVVTANGQMPVNRPQALQSVDAVIVLQQTTAPVLTARPTTRADSAETKALAAPATRPLTQP